MTTVSPFELRLLMCSLGGSITAPLHHSDGDDLQDAIESVLLNVQKGAFSDALSFPSVKSLLWQPQNSMWEPSSNNPDEFYNSLRSHVQCFVSCGDGGGEDLAGCRAILAMAFGVAALLAFWQANVTGPSAVFPTCQSLVLQDNMEMLNEKDCDTWALKQLMVDGCDLAGLCALPQYMILAKILLVDTLEAAKNGQICMAKLPSTISWWALRALLTHQLILTERSSSLRTGITALKSVFFQVVWGLDVDSEYAPMCRTAAQLEYGFVEYVYGHVDKARSHFEAAKEACGLELSLKGVLGFRTAYQVDPKAQMVLVASTQGEWPKEPEHSSLTTSKDDDAGKRMEEDILMVPKLVTSDKNEHKKILSSLEQAVILAQCLDVKKSNPDDELRGWQMAPFIEAVDAQEFSPFMIKCCCQLMRTRWEGTRSRTKQRALLMLEQLVKDVREITSCDVEARMHYAFCSHFPLLSVLRKELAEMMVSCGLIGEALQIFEELELWNSLIDCYCLLGKKAAALELIKNRLEQQPDDPRLWCALGDVTLHEESYRTAWEVSKHRFSRAQRSLGRSAYNKGEYGRSMEHWEAALALNSLHAEGWFALGSASLKARKLDKAVDAFTRAVQLEPENGEAWNNIAAIHMTKRKSKEAFVAFREALKFKRSSWQMWENYAHVALDVGNFGQAIEALNMVLDLSQGKRINGDCLAKLMEEVESRFRTGASSNNIENGTPGCHFDGLEQKVGFDKAFERFVSQSKESVLVSEHHLTEREWLVTRVGKLLSKVVQTSQSSTTWGLLARWHRVKGDLAMCSEALLKQVRSLQGSDWQHNRDKFEELGQAALQLCDVYMEVSSKLGDRKGLYSAQMLLRNLVKQAETLSYTEMYSAIVTKLSDIQQMIETSK